MEFIHEARARTAALAQRPIVDQSDVQELIAWHQELLDRVESLYCAAVEGISHQSELTAIVQTLVEAINRPSSN